MLDCPTQAFSGSSPTPLPCPSAAALPNDQMLLTPLECKNNYADGRYLITWYSGYWAACDFWHLIIFFYYKIVSL